MSQRQNIYLTGGVLGLVIISMLMTGYFTQQARDQSVENSNHINKINSTITQFIDQWQKRVNISNGVNNMTQNKLVNITNDLQNTEDNILGNLTRHRIVANYTRDQVIDLQNQTQQLIQQFNNTNEEKRSEAVNNILSGVNNIIKQLNTTQQQSVANLTAQHDDILEILKHMTNSTSD